MWIEKVLLFTALVIFCSAMDVLGINAPCLCANFPFTHLVHLETRLVEETSGSNHVIPSLLSQTKEVCCGSHHLTGWMYKKSLFCHHTHTHTPRNILSPKIRQLLLFWSSERVLRPCSANWHRCNAGVSW